MNAVEFQGVSKTYAIYESPGDRLRELLSLNRLRRHRDFQALQDLTFEVKRGETFCIVGENGSGKSTMLQMVAGILQPTAGTVAVNGRVSALLELGAGFNPEFSGRDNVYLNGSILGLTTRQIDQRYSDIQAFAEIGEFINQPVKTYSSGMVVRLAFAVAIYSLPRRQFVHFPRRDGGPGLGRGRHGRCRCRCLRLGLRCRDRGGAVVGEELPPALADRVGIGQETVVHVVDEPGVGPE